MSESPNNNNDNKKIKFNNFGKMGPNKDPNDNNVMKNLMIWLILIAGIFSVFIFTQNVGSQYHPVKFT